MRNGDRVREARLAKLWTQRRLAREADLAERTISTIERGLHEPSPLTQERIARALGVTREELFPEPEEAAV